YDEFVEKLYTTAEGKAKGRDIIRLHEEFITALTQEKEFGDKQTRAILAEGELISTQLFHAYLVEQGYNAVLLPALEFMRIDEDNEPMLSYTEEKLGKLLKDNANA